MPWENPEERAVAELHAVPGARVAGEHLHPDLHERFTVAQGELTVMRDGERSTLGPGETAEIEAGVWHDWWNAGDVDAIVRVEITPGERFVHMIETIYGLAREGHVNAKGMPSPLQCAIAGVSDGSSSGRRSCSIPGARPRPRLPRHLPQPLARRPGTPRLVRLSESPESKRPEGAGSSSGP